MEQQRALLQSVHKELQAKQGQDHLLAPYMATPPVVVAPVMQLAAVGPEDTVFDIGCGDGRLLCAAAKLGAQCYGWDISPEAVEDAKQLIAKEGIEEKVCSQRPTETSWVG